MLAEAEKKKQLELAAEETVVWAQEAAQKAGANLENLESAKEREIDQVWRNRNYDAVLARKKIEEIENNYGEKIAQANIDLENATQIFREEQGKMQVQRANIEARFAEHYARAQLPRAHHLKRQLLEKA